jgi:hypothetical protein
MKYLLSNPEKYDSFILGNSRANNIDCEKLPNGKWHNLYYSLGLPKEHLEDLNVLLNHKVKIKNILLCLDMSSYMISYQSRENDPLRKTVKDNIWDRYKYYIEYICQVPQTDFRKEILKTKPNDIYKDILIKGVARDNGLEQFIINNQAAYIRDPKFSTPIIMGYENNSEALLADIQKIVLFCKEHAINIKVLVNPIHKSAFLVNNYNLFFDFLKRLVLIADFYDFSGINKITSNNYFFYETAHFRPLIGNAMVDYIYHDKRIDSIPDFGIHINKENIDTHMEKLKHEVAIEIALKQ